MLENLLTSIMVIADLKCILKEDENTEHLVESLVEKAHLHHDPKDNHHLTSRQINDVNRAFRRDLMEFNQSKSKTHDEIFRHRRNSSYIDIEQVGNCSIELIDCINCIFNIQILVFVKNILLHLFHETKQICRTLNLPYFVQAINNNEKKNSRRLIMTTKAEANV